jgi:hypothetical protein
VRKRHNQTFRVVEPVRAKLQQEADRNQRSISEQVERIIEGYFEQRDAIGEPGRLVSAAVQAIERKNGKPWYDESMAPQCWGAVEGTLSVLFGPRPDVRDLRQQVDAEIDRPANKLIGPDRARVDRMMDEIKAWLNGVSTGRDIVIRDLNQVAVSDDLPSDDPGRPEQEFLKNGPSSL